MKIRTQLYTSLALPLLLTLGGIGTAVAQQPPDVVNSDPNGNTAMGTSALLNQSGSAQNTASGFKALFSNTIGSVNTATGFDALLNNTIGSSNTASGTFALSSNTTGGSNTANGFSARQFNKTGIRNIAVGGYALNYNQTGNNNIGIGYQSGYFAKGSNNIEIGNAGLAADNNVIRIGTQGKQTFTAIVGISGVNVTGGAPVVVNSKGQLGVVSSSRRYKEDIRSMGTVSDRLLALRPVTFRYKKADENGQKPEQYGLIAEEVAQVMPELVVYNEKGQPETVAYQSLTPLLLNELQREHKRAEQQVSGLQRQLATQNQQLNALRARVAGVDTLQAEVAELRRLTTQLVARQQ